MPCHSPALIQEVSARLACWYRVRRETLLDNLGAPFLDELSLPLALTSAKPCGEPPEVERQVEGRTACRKASVIKLHRPIMSRYCRDTLRVQATFEPRNISVNGVGACCGLCRAPEALPCCAFFCPCCAFPEELEEARRESSYLVVRDNAVEFNNPKVRAISWKKTREETGTIFRRKFRRKFQRKYKPVPHWSSSYA